MSYEEKRSKPGPHHLTLEDRSKLTISGVEDVDSFDENAIAMSTTQGLLLIRGAGLHIEKLSLDGGDLAVEGTVDSITYEDRTAARGGLLARLFHP